MRLKKHVIILLAYCTILLGWAVFLRSLSSSFSYDIPVADMPIFTLTAALVFMGAVYGFMAWSLTRIGTPSHAKCFLLLIFFSGLAARLILFGSTPLLEDDYQRYMLDGAISSQGYSPYRWAPIDLQQGQAPSEILAIGDASQPVLSRVNHPHLRTIYPIGAQFFFALSARIAPFKLYSFKLLYLLADVLTLFFLLKLLRQFKQPLIYTSLYWLNPVLIKEVYNSVHMDILLLPFLMGGLFAFIKARGLLASVVISLAAMIKLWPALLLPLIWVTMRKTPCKCAAAILLAMLAGAACLAPFILSGLDQTSGLMAYLQKWQTNSGFFALFQPIFAPLHPMALRGFVAITLIALSLYLAYKPLPLSQTERRECSQLHSFLLMVCAMFLLSPAQFPWYLIWVVPFLPLCPLRWVIALTPLIQLYYLRFYYHAHGGLDIAGPIVLAIIWFPILILLGKDVRTKWPVFRRAS